MAKRNKKKAGLQKKVSSLFNSVSIPERDGSSQRSGTPASDGATRAHPESECADTLILQSSLMKKLLRSESSPDKAAKDHTKTDRKRGVPPKLTGSADLIQKRAEENEPSQTENLLDVTEPDDNVKILPEEPVPEHPISQQPSLEKPLPIEKMLDEAAPDSFAEAPSEQVVPDLPIRQDPPAEESPQAKDESNTAAPDFEMSVPSWMKSPEYADSCSSLMEESTQSEESSDKSELNSTVEDTRKAENRPIPAHPSGDVPDQP